MDRAGFKKLLAVGVAIFGLGLCPRAGVRWMGSAWRLLRWLVRRLLWLWLRLGWLRLGWLRLRLGRLWLWFVLEFVLRHVGRLFRIRLHYVR